MGRIAKPTALKLIEGNPGKRRISDEVKPSMPARVPSPPAVLNEYGKQEWRRLARALRDLGLLTNLDRAAFTAYCAAFGVWVDAERALALTRSLDQRASGLVVKTTNGNVVQSPLVGIARRARADVIRFAAEFGMTPAARAGMVVAPEDEDADAIAAATRRYL